MPRCCLYVPAPLYYNPFDTIDRQTRLKHIQNHDLRVETTKKIYDIIVSEIATNKNLTKRKKSVVKALHPVEFVLQDEVFIDSVNYYVSDDTCAGNITYTISTSF